MWSVFGKYALTETLSTDIVYIYIDLSMSISYCRSVQFFFLLLLASLPALPQTRLGDHLWLQDLRTATGEICAANLAASEDEGEHADTRLVPLGVLPSQPRIKNM